MTTAMCTSTSRSSWRGGWRTITCRSRSWYFPTRSMVFFGIRRGSLPIEARRTTSTGSSSARPKPHDAARAAWCGELLPGPALSNRVEHAGEAHGRVLPVRLHRALGLRAIPRLECLDDGVVLGYRGRNLAHERARVDASIPLGLRLDRVVQCAQTRTGADIHVSLMKGIVEIVEPVGVGEAHLRGLEELRVQLSHVARHHQSHRLGLRGGLAGGESLDLRHDHVDLARVVVGERGDGRAREERASRGDDVALLAQSFERGSYRGAAHAESRGNLSFDEAASGGEPSAHDALAKLLVHCERAVAACNRRHVRVAGERSLRGPYCVASSHDR